MEVNGSDKGKNLLNRTQRNKQKERNESKIQAFEKHNETDQPLANLIKIKIERTNKKY